MNTLIVPTDFSASAENAALFGAHLAQQIGARLLLVHVYQIPVTMNDMPVMVLSADELRRSADEQLARQQEELRAQFPEVDIAGESRLGNINDELDDLCNEIQPLALIMGTHGTSGLERMLFGSTTALVMRHNCLPVIAVPKDHKKYSLRKMVLAADLQEPAKIPTQRIIDVTQRLGASLDLVHVAINNASVTDAAQEMLHRLGPVQPTFHTVQSANVRDGLMKYLRETDADLLLVLPHEHNLVERLFFKLHTEDILRHAPVPVMAIKC